jgi:hypothetical protein
MKAHEQQQHGRNEAAKSCPTCHHWAVCGIVPGGQGGCESWEGEHPK